MYAKSYQYLDTEEPLSCPPDAIAILTLGPGAAALIMRRAEKRSAADEAGAPDDDLVATKAAALVTAAVGKRIIVLFVAGRVLPRWCPS